MPAICSFIKEGYEYSLHTYEPERFDVERRPINPKTGKPWQARRTQQVFKGPKAKMLGLRAMLVIRNGKWRLPRLPRVA